jgi:hypothetical protein
VDLPTPGAIRKFFTTDTERVAWIHNADTLPFRGAALNAKWLTRGQLDCAVETYDFHALTFKMWIPDDAARYEQIQDRIATGWYVEKHVERHWNSEHHAPAIYLEWIEQFNELPPQVLHSPNGD